MSDCYYLTPEELKHYQYMLDRGYAHTKVDAGRQTYIVFEVVDKSYIGIAWPTISGRLDGLSQYSDTLFEYDVPLQRVIMKSVNNKNIRILLFPRYNAN